MLLNGMRHSMTALGVILKSYETNQITDCHDSIIAFPQLFLSDCGQDNPASAAFLTLAIATEKR